MTTLATTISTTNDRTSSIVGRAVLVALLLVAGGFSTRAADRKASPNDGVIAGSVFNESGRSIRGARVVIAPESAPKKKHEATSDGRGEFAVRVPADGGPYVVTVEAKGFAPESKKVEVFVSEKVNVTFLLAAK